MNTSGLLQSKWSPNFGSIAKLTWSLNELHLTCKRPEASWFHEQTKNRIHFVNKWSLSFFNIIFIEKCKSLIYSADLTFRVIRKMDFNRAEPTCYKLIFLRPVNRLTKWSFFVHSTTRNTLRYYRGLIRFSNIAGLSQLSNALEEPFYYI